MSIDNYLPVGLTGTEVADLFFFMSACKFYGSDAQSLQIWQKTRRAACRLCGFSPRPFVLFDFTVCIHFKVHMKWNFRPHFYCFIWKCMKNDDDYSLLFLNIYSRSRVTRFEWMKFVTSQVWLERKTFMFYLFFCCCKVMIDLLRIIWNWFVYLAALT